MYVYKYNKYTKKYYKYQLDEYDAHEPKFNENIHVNHVDPYDLPRQQCAYCGYVFDSRNKLFNHLGFLGIDIRKKSKLAQRRCDGDGDGDGDGDLHMTGCGGHCGQGYDADVENSDEYNSDMGDFGFEITSSKFNTFSTSRRQRKKLSSKKRKQRRREWFRRRNAVMKLLQKRTRKNRTIQDLTTYLETLQVK
jgi:hypothetical protein